MSLKKFQKNEVFRSHLKIYPQVNFFINDRKVYFNNKGIVPGHFVDNVFSCSVGNLSLYEENVDRPFTSKIYPYVVKDGTLSAFKTVSTSDFNSDYGYGDVISSSYPLTASISIDRFDTNASRAKINALENTLNYYRTLSPHYAYSSSIGLGYKGFQKIALISIPSIFYGSSIQKGSVDLKFYISGTLFARAQDLKRNGELVQSEPYGSVGSGSVVGVCLYNEGFILLTGSWNITTDFKDVYEAGSASVYPQWYYFGSTGSSGANENIPSSSFNIDFNGINYINTLTCFCHANRADCDQSNNPTWIQYGQNTTPITSAYTFEEPTNLKIKNIVKSPFLNASASFEKTVYINKIVLFDKDKRAIGVAKLSKPLRKREQDSLTVKLKIDTL